MVSLRGVLVGRARWLIVFTLVLFVTSAVPVLADPEAPAEEPPVVQEDPASAPSEEEIVEALDEGDEDLASPAAIEEREDSREAYAGLSAIEAQDLLASAFPEQLKALNADPGRALSEFEVEKVLGAHGARISIGEGESAIVESSVPIESDVGGQGMEPIDLTLERVGESFLPENPLTETELPGSADDPIRLQGGIRVELPASNDRGAELLGDKNLFYAETGAATDTLVSPIAGGVEVFEQLRSPESPEQFRYALGLPGGAVLRESQGGGAEVVSADGEELLEVAPAWAVDSQGAEVPVTMGIEGETLVVEIPHRSREVAYPLLLDPRFNNGYESPPFLSNDWVPVATAEYSLSRSASSLVAISKGNDFSYGANTWGQWEYTAPGSTAYIENAAFSDVYFFPNKCQTAQPYGYTGIYNVYSGSHHSPLGVYGTWQSYTSSFYVGGGGVGTRKATVGIGTTDPSKLGCAHELYVGGVTVQENDPEKPSIDSVSNVPSGWFNPATVGKATIVASDPGFGVSMMSVGNLGAGASVDHAGCTGMSGSRCLPQRSWSIAPPYKEGERTLQVTAEDPTSKVGDWKTTTKVDVSEPKIRLEGQLAEVTKQEGEEEKEQELGDDRLRLSAYNLKIKATDGDPEGEPKDQRSGVKDVAVFLDGKEKAVDWEPKPSPCMSCEMNVIYTLDLSEVEGGGVHKLKVIATDQIGHSLEREIEFEYFPATGMKEEYLLHHFPLPNGEGNESEEEHPVRPELAVNVANGNLVYRQRDVEVEGPAVNLEVERFYNSQLPAEDSTEWGEGWTLAQTPKLEPEDSGGPEPPSKASMIRTSGALESAVDLPVEPEGTHFAPELQAVVTKEPDGGYEIVDESGETDTALAFDQAGKTQELRTSGSARIEYSYEGGELAEIAVDDPASSGLSPQQAAAAPEPPVHVSSLLSAGEGAFGYAQDIAVGAAGRIYLLDSSNNRVLEFGSAGEYLGQFGETGSGQGQLNNPRAIAVGPESHVFVADSGNWRVQEFDAAGEYVDHFGSQGSGPGQFGKGVGGVALDAVGNVYASNYSGQRINKFDPEGNYVGQIADPSLANPYRLAFDEEGRLWAVDQGNYRVARFSPQGEYLGQVGEGDLAAPRGIAIDSTGAIWIVDSEGDSVKGFEPGGELFAQFGSQGSGEGQLEAPTGLAIDAKGDFLVADPGNSRIQKWVTPAAPALDTDTASAVGESTATLNATVDPRGIETEYRFEYGITDSYGSVAPAGEAIAPGAEDVPVSAELEGLKPWVIYHYRVVASNAEGASHGEDGTFTTRGAWTLESPPNPLVSDSTSLADVSCTSSISCLAVGLDDYASRAIAESWNGEKWTLIEGVADRRPTSVSCGSANACWAVGTIEGAEGTPLIERWLRHESGEWGGAKAPPLLVPEGATGSYLSGISCTAEAQCTAVGRYLKEGQSYPLIERLESSQWTIQPTPEVAAAFLGDVDCAAPNECLAVGYTQVKKGSRKALAMHWDGEAWSTVAVPEGEWAKAELSSVSCATPDSCAAVGAAGSEEEPFIVSFDGADLSLASTPEFEPNDRLSGVSCASEDACLAVGRSAGSETFALGWDGSGWEPRSSPTPEGKTAWLYGVSCVEPLACAAVGGSYGAGETEALAERIELRNQVVSTESATAVTDDGATLRGAVNPRGIATTYQFEYGLTPAYGQVTPAAPGSVGSGSKEVEIDRELEGLQSSRLYHYRVIATSEVGVTYGEDQTFSTPPPMFAFGLEGEGLDGGDLGAVSGLATDAEGRIYVVDTSNDRIVKFGAGGRYLDQFGEEGSAPGQFQGPGDIEVSPDGYLYVADSGNSRVQKLGPNGEYVDLFGAHGTGNGEFGQGIGGLAVDQAGNVFVSDTANHRIQKFDSQGSYASQFGKEGTANGQLKAPGAIVAGEAGNLWVVDASNSRIQQFTTSGQYLSQFGKEGSGEGEFQGASGIALDSTGDPWVVDSGGDRVQEFDSQGTYLSQFGSGVGQAQLEGPEAIEIDPAGSVIVAEPAGHRVQKWFLAKRNVEGDPGVALEDDPTVDIETPGGLVESVEGEEAGETVYEHEGELLTAVDGPKGETQYEYDSETQLTEVELPNSTSAQIHYDDFSRVKAVTASTPEGTQTTHFHYSLEPARRTVVSPEGGQAVTYDIGEDGSVFKWWNTLKPPEIGQLSGGLYEQRGEVHPEPITIGDQTLLAPAYSEEGIASIKIVANGNQLVAEKTCEQDYSNEVTECIDVAKEWVTHTENWAPGILQLEIVATDTLGQTSGERFWVNIPHTPPPGSEAADPPKFAEILRFREAHGLDLDLEGDEMALNERIFELISTWHNPNTPAGEVARATEERWGVPLRAVDAAELEYRIAYWQQAVVAIPTWAEANASGSFAGYYLDERAGGLMRVGFTSKEIEGINALRDGLDLQAESRIVAFITKPDHSLASLRSLASQISTAAASNPAAKINRVSVASENNEVRVGSSAVAAATSFIQSQFGTGVPIAVYEAGPIPAAIGRERISGKMLGGERIQIKGPSEEEGECTTGFGAFEYGTKSVGGSEILRLFALTAAHCGALNSAVIRRRVPPPNEKEDRVRAGFIRRHGYDQHQTAISPLDVAAVKLEGHIEPRRVYISSRRQPHAIRAWSTVGPGTSLCHSGATTNRVECGPITTQEPSSYIQCEFSEETGECVGPEILLRQWCFDAPLEPGDSGSPVWIEGTNTAVGISSSGRSTTCAAAVAFDERFPDMASVFSDPSMGPLGGLTTALTAE